MKLFCLFGYHKPGLGFSNFTNGIFPGKLDGLHEVSTSYKCLNCGKFFNLDSTMEIRDSLNVLKRNELEFGKKQEILELLERTNLSIKDISQETKVSETSIRRLIKKSK